MPHVLQPGTRLTLEVIAATDLQPGHTLWAVTDNRGYHLWTEGVPITTTPTPHGERWLNADQHLVPADSRVLVEVAGTAMPALVPETLMANGRTGPLLAGRTIDNTGRSCPLCQTEGRRTLGGYTPQLRKLPDDPREFCIGTHGWITEADHTQPPQ